MFISCQVDHHTDEFVLVLRVVPVVCAVLTVTLLTALFCRAVFETVIKPSSHIKFTWRKHPRMFWALLLCCCAFFSFLHLGSRDTPICYDWIQAELPDSVTEVPLASTHTTAPSLADKPLVSVSSVEVASSHAAGCCYPVLRISVPDTQPDEMTSLVTSFPAAVSEEGYVTVPFWELQEPALAQLGQRHCKQATAHHYKRSLRHSHCIQAAPLIG